MQFDPEHASVGEVYSLMIRAITPRPVAWVSTCSSEGIQNLAPFSYFNGVCSAPPALSIAPINKPDGSKKDTLRNIEANGQFVVNVVPAELAEQMQQTSAEYDYTQSEFSIVDVESVASTRVKPHRVARSPINFECELMQIVRIGEGPFAASLIIGRILLVHVDDRVLNEKGKIDPLLVDTVGRMGGLEYSFTRDRFSLPPARVQKQNQKRPNE